MYYNILILASVLGSVNNVWLMKKYQMTAGTRLYANVLLMIINGAVSALISVAALLVSHETFETTPYSLFMAFVTVLWAAVSTLGILKGYEVGQIAIVNLFSVTGSVLLSCLWGLAFLKERISARQLVAILLIVAALPLFTAKGQKQGRRLDLSGETWRILWIYALVFFSSGLVNIFSRLHQIEERYAVAGTLSFSIWIGVIRAFSFALFLPFLKPDKRPLSSGKVCVCATATSMLSGGCYIMTLIVTAALPLTVTAPLGTGISMGLTALLPWILYREKLCRREIGGILLSILGIVLYV